MTIQIVLSLQRIRSSRPPPPSSNETFKLFNIYNIYNTPINSYKIYTKQLDLCYSLPKLNNRRDLVIRISQISLSIIARHKAFIMIINYEYNI